MNILTEGAAWKDGRLKPGDQILTINGISPVGLTKEQASETLNAAVSRGIGPEAKPDTIRLTIQRQVLDQDSDTSKSSSVDNNDSTMSPITQASNSNKLSHDSSSKTNDTSSAISQITDMTTIPPIENSTSENSEIQQAFTSPKMLDDPSVKYNQNDVVAAQSCDEESLIDANGDSFQRDGFGRQSISEKRHATLNAKNTDTFKRNQKLREERERQKQLQDQLEKQKIQEAERLKRETNNFYSNHYNANNHQRHISASSSANFDSSTNNMCRAALADQVSASRSYSSDFANGLYREVAVDAQVSLEGSQLDTTTDRYDSINNCNIGNSEYVQRNDVAKQASFYNDNNYGYVSHQNQRLMQPIQYQTDNAQFMCAPQHIRKSNSHESIQNQQRNCNIDANLVPRSGTVRVSRNRKINESFRAAVDRSYEIAVNDSHRLENSVHINGNNMNMYEVRQNGHLSSMMTNASNSTSPTSTDYKPLVRSTESDGNTQSSKRGSLLSRFLKFGSIKKKDKKKNLTGANSNINGEPKKKQDLEVSQQIENIQPNHIYNSYNQSRTLQYVRKGKDDSVANQFETNKAPYQINGTNQVYYNHGRAQMYSPNFASNGSIVPAQSQQPLYQTVNGLHQAQLSNQFDNEPLYQQHLKHAQIHLNNHQQTRQPQLPKHVTSEKSHMQQIMNCHLHVPTTRSNYGLVNQQHQPTHLSHTSQAPSQLISQHQPIARQQPHQLHHSNQNGLWVVNPMPVASGSSLSQSPPPLQAHHKISQRISSMYVQMPNYQMQQQPYVVHQATSQHSTINEPHMHQASLLTGHAPTMTQQRLQSQQPQPIYYYDC